MTIKYYTEIQSFNCDLTNFNEIEMEAFRWTFDDINDARNFNPVSINDPSRKEQLGCLGYALSFFVTKEASLNRHNTLTANRPNLYKKLGTHISSGGLMKSDGIASEPDDLKHFDFFTYDNVELNDKFTILESIL